MGKRDGEEGPQFTHHGVDQPPMATGTYRNSADWKRGTLQAGIVWSIAMLNAILSRLIHPDHLVQDCLTSVALALLVWLSLF